MRKLGIGLGLLLLAAIPWIALIGNAPKAQVGPANQIICNQYGTFTVASATTTSIVAGVAGQHINICGWHVTTTQAAATDTFQFEYGTQGGPCTTPTTFTPALSVSNAAPSADHIDWASYSTPLGTQLCVVTAGTTVAVTGIVFYSQF